MSTPAGWFPDPTGRAEQRYYDGSRWTDHVSRAGAMDVDPLAAPSPPASEVLEYGLPGEDPKVRRAGFVMVGVAAVAIVAAFLPWATVPRRDSLSGFGWGPGRYTAGVALLLALYGAQALLPGRTRVGFHGGAIALIVAGELICMFSYSVLDAVDQITLGVTGADAGTGLDLSVVLFLVAVWPMVVLRRDDRRRRKAGDVARVQRAMQGNS